VSRSSTAPDGDAPVRSLSEIVITKSMDSASPALRQQSLNGEGVTIQIDFVKSRETYLTYTLQDALISSYQPGSTTESLSLNFTKMTTDMHGAGPDISSLAGVLMRGWNASPGTRCLR
jgi:type VI secretion system secreted protein Hcp